jgi:DNA polymerase-1
MAATEKTLLLIDGSNLAFRMYFALEMSNLRDSQGNPTWAVYGTLKALFDVIKFAKPSSAAVAFDLPEPTYRHEVFSEYKANRPDEMPDDLQQQWGLIKEAFSKFHIPVLEEPGFEADDMIGIMAKKAEQEGYKVVILSGDKDLYQLINQNISMAVPKRGGGLEIFTPGEVYEKMGVHPVQVPDYKGIAGDSSDNIPGVRGLGPKAAIKLLSDFGNLENIYKNIEKVGPPKTKEKLVEQESNARMSKHIATIITTADGVKNCDLNLDHCLLDMPDTENLVKFLQDLEFKSMVAQLPNLLKPFNNGETAVIKNISPKTNAQDDLITAEPATISDDKWDKLDTPLEDFKTNQFTVIDEFGLNILLKELEKSNHYAIDLETDGLNTFNCQIVGWAFATSEEKLFYIPVKHSETQLLKPDYVINKLKPYLEDSNKLQILQNAKFEHKIFARHEIKTHDNFFDTMLASYVDNPANKHGLKTQSKRVFHLKMLEIEDVIGSGRKQITIDQAPLELVARYACADACMTLKLFNHYQNTLSNTEKDILKNIEFPLVKVLEEIELNGVAIDSSFFKDLGKEVHEQISIVENKIFQYCKTEFNISSPKQLSDIMFGSMGLPPVGKKTKAGGYSTSVSTLEALLTEYDIDKTQKLFLESILEYRSLTKLASTYIDTLPNLINKSTGRIHTEFNQVGTTTGRLSSSNPNLQNIPIRSELGKRIRQGFVPGSNDYEILSADYSQIELRVLAHMANAQVLIDAFQQGQDIHKRTAMEIFDISDEKLVSNEQRSIGKTLNFALIYMQGAFSTAKQLGITNQEAKDFINRYFKAFPSIKPYMDEVLNHARQKGYTETLFGRKRYFQNINSPNGFIAKEEERQAFNAALQGTAADIMKIAMINVSTSFKKNNLKSKIILQVHDELVIETALEEKELVRKILEEEMSQAVKLRVPLIVDIGIGKNWFET